MSRPFVLIVDDDDLVRSLLRMTLPAEGLDLIEAQNGEEALEVVAKGVPALVLLDWRMPGLSGADVLAELKRRQPGTPVIVLTVESDPRQREMAKSLGADVFLTKPFSPLHLLGTVERVLADRALNERA